MKILFAKQMYAKLNGSALLSLLGMDNFFFVWISLLLSFVYTVFNVLC